MKNVLLGLALSVLLTLTAAAQTAKPTSAQPPADVSGMYSFLQEGEFVQITVEDRGKVSGFVSRYGDSASDKGAFLDQFIKTGSLDGSKLAFTTDPLHGVWYEFHGTVGRGDGKAPTDEAYYVLRGTLTQYQTDAAHKTSARSRDVLFKSFPQDAGPTPGKRD